MTDRLAELYRGVAVHATADAEHRAALELLTLVMLADDHIDDVEVDVVREISQEWRGDDLAFEDHIRAAIESARRAIETARTAEFLDNIDATISSRLLRHALFSAAREVAGANEAVSPAEGTIIAEVALRFS
ncbi:MAG: TerB family tellurite resistance protein [Ilumatobacter sp.]|nr:TerB family tellurite resistance protein [bacterium]MDG1265562.1 TerB family tellurite resistance protein [Ilumatobacter sp.]